MSSSTVTAAEPIRAPGDTNGPPPLALLVTSTAGVAARGLGGAEMVLLDVLSTMPKARSDRSTLIVAGEGELSRQARQAAPGLIVAPLPPPPALLALGDALGRGRGLRGKLALLQAAPAVAGYLIALRDLLDALRPAVVRSNDLKGHILASWAAPRDALVVWHLHDYVSDRNTTKTLLRLSASSRVKVVAVSRSVANDAALALQGRLPPDSVRAVWNRVDLQRFRPPADDDEARGDAAWLDAQAGLTPSTSSSFSRRLRVGLIATHARWKGHEVVLKAARQVEAIAPGSCRWFLVGGPIYAAEGSQHQTETLRAIAGELGLPPDLVGFTGHLDDPARAYRGLDLIVHASTRPEPFGRTLIEAAAAGRPVLTSALGGAAEVAAALGDGTRAVPAGDPDALAASVVELVSWSTYRLRELGRHARRRAADHFNLDQWREPGECPLDG